MRELLFSALFLCLSGCFFFSDLEPMEPIEPGPTDTGTDLSGDPDVDRGVYTVADAAEVTGTQENGSRCIEDEDCVSGNCQNNICCVEGRICCSLDSHCEGDPGGMLACDTESAYCYEACVLESAELDQNCQDGMHCDPEGCEPDLVLGVCDEGSDCASGHCENGYCCEHYGHCCWAHEQCPDLFSHCATDNTRTCVFKQFVFPHSGQTSCYDLDDTEVPCTMIGEGEDYYGQDGHFTDSGRYYLTGIEHSVDIVEDQVTGLVWTQSSSDLLNWSDAQSYCYDLAPEMMWRLPKRYELLTLVDYGQGDFFHPSDFDQPTGSIVFWTSSTVYDTYGDRIWVVSFEDGTSFQQAYNVVGARARCVRELLDE